jgi:para-nitrobenzyl esterase
MLDAIDTASRFRIPATRLAEAQARHQPATYLYLFDWESPGQRGQLGACHALELSFVFGTLDRPGNERFAGSGPEAEKLSGQMMDAWLAFAKTGDPSCAAVGRWAAHDADTRQTMIFGKHTRLESAPFEEERALWAGLL